MERERERERKVERERERLWVPTYLYVCDGDKGVWNPYVESPYHTYNLNN
jgi:hypothetical protein